MVVGILGNLGMLLGKAVHQRYRTRIGRSQAHGQARAARSGNGVVLVDKELAQIGIGARSDATIGSALEHRVGECRPLLNIAQGAENLSQIKTILAVHGVPAHRLDKCIACALVILLLNAHVCHIGIQTIKRSRHCNDTARIMLNARIA